MHFNFHRRWNKLSIFLNVPWANAGKQVCFDWALERLSSVVNYAPIEIRAYDYVQPDYTMSRLVPVQIQPALLGYSFVDAVHKARPKIDSLAMMQQQRQTRESEPRPPRDPRRN